MPLKIVHQDPTRGPWLVPVGRGNTVMPQTSNLGVIRKKHSDPICPEFGLSLTFQLIGRQGSKLAKIAVVLSTPGWYHIHIFQPGKVLIHKSLTTVIELQQYMPVRLYYRDIEALGNFVKTAGSK
jgi:hypothetical protein